MEIQDNKLFLGNIKAEELIKKFGSPLFVYEEDIIRERISSLIKSIKYPKLRIHYACKANTNIKIMSILREEGAYIDAVSPGEIFLALKAGYDAKHILYTGNNSTDEDFQYCIKNNILVNIGSLSQIERYGKLNPGSKISIRINPDVGAGHHDHTITGGPDSKFGIYYDKITDIKEAAKNHKLKIIGIHSHIGSGILETARFMQAMDIVLKTAKEFDDLEFVDFGGGIGIPYKPTDKAIDMDEFGSHIGKRFADFAKDYGKEIILALEPGRYLVGEAGKLLVTVNNIKSTPKHIFVGTDSGFNHLIRPMAYGSYHEIINASNVDGKKAIYKIAGNLCESGDVFTPEDREMTEIHEGDILAIMNAGAYGFSMSSHYNSRLLPAEILVSEGKAEVIRERENYEDLLLHQNF